MPILALLLACGAPPPPGASPSPEPVAAPAPAPAASVTPISGVDLAALLAAPHDRPRVVNFWATWCAPCVEELPRLRDWARARPDVDLILVDLDIAALRTKKVEPFVTAHDLGGFASFQLSDSDPARGVQAAFPEFAGGVPFTLVIPPAGQGDRTAIQGALETAQLDALLPRG